MYQHKRKILVYSLNDKIFDASWNIFLYNNILILVRNIPFRGSNKKKDRFEIDSFRYKLSQYSSESAVALKSNHLESQIKIQRWKALK